MDEVLRSLLLTSEICALREQKQLQRLSDVTEVVQHVLQVFLVSLPTTLNEDKAGHLHCPAWEVYASIFVKLITSYTRLIL